MSEENTLRDIRLDKLRQLRELGMDPFSVEKFDRTDTAKGLKDGFEQGRAVSFAGRIVRHHETQGGTFADLSDGDGKFQIHVTPEVVSPKEWSAFELLELGDHVGVTGFLDLTDKGYQTIRVQTLTPLTKSLQPIPFGKRKGNKVFDGLEDLEIRCRHRHLDLICNPSSRAMLINRSRMTSAVRRYFDSIGYLEVETPILQMEAGGAAARPFVTHHNEEDLEVKLRISLELYLKRLICGDIPAVYEIGRVFRNEGVSNRHNPEFTMLEFYEAYVNLETMMERVQDCFKAVSTEVFGSPEVHMEAIPGKKGREAVTLDFSKPWHRVDMLEEIERHTGLTAEELSDFGHAIAAAREKHVESKARKAGGAIDLAKEENLGGFLEKLLEVFVEPTMQEPTFVVGYPIETSPLAKKDPNNPRMTRRFEGYVLGREVCNAFSEINDPMDQRERFENQLAQRAKGNDEAHPMDEEFIYALECGMPPTGGCGIGLDRMAMLLTGADHIRDVLMFPFMRPI